MSSRYAKPLETVERACTKCKVFTTIKRFPDNTWCASCKNTDTRERRKRLGEVHRARQREQLRRYRAAGKFKERDKRNAALARQRHPVEARARALLKNAMLRGDIIKPSNCSACNATGRIEGHHLDYTKPLDVEWFCVSCHRAIHRRLKEVPNG